SYVWSENAGQSRRAAERIRAGTVWVNTALITDYSTPTGGFKQSGWGRESGPEGLEPYLESKSIVSQ
ncbi:MAG: Aldehyde Dehydrogenase, partial [Brevundimonas sp.]|nr:Aldehyde Dehydrogenase [Brevundimonas sp.]